MEIYKYPSSKREERREENGGTTKFVRRGVPDGAGQLVIQGRSKDEEQVKGTTGRKLQASHL